MIAEIRELLLSLSDKNQDIQMNASIKLDEFEYSDIMPYIHDLNNDPLIVKSLLKALKDNDREIVLSAISYIGWLEIKEACTKLIKLIKNKDPIIRIYIYESIGNADCEAAIPYLIKRLSGEKHNLAFCYLVMALGFLNAKPAIQILNKMKEELKFSYLKLHLSASLFLLGQEKELELVFKWLNWGKKERLYYVRMTSTFLLIPIAGLSNLNVKNRILKELKIALLTEKKDLVINEINNAISIVTTLIEKDIISGGKNNDCP